MINEGVMVRLRYYLALQTYYGRYAAVISVVLHILNMVGDFYYLILAPFYSYWFIVFSLLSILATMFIAMTLSLKSKCICAGLFNMTHWFDFGPSHTSMVFVVV